MIFIFDLKGVIDFDILYNKINKIIFFVINSIRKIKDK